MMAETGNAFEASTPVAFRLTSTVIPNNAKEGTYPFYQLAFLIPHEPLRRELVLGKKAFDNFDPVAHPWKMGYLAKWFKEFLNPVIHNHHHVEETIIHPNYKNMNVDVPVSMTTSHGTILEKLAKIDSLFNEIIVLFKVSPDQAEQTLSPKVLELREVYTSMYDEMFEHFGEEETFWPAVIEAKGEKFYQSVEKEIIKKELSLKGNSVQLFLSAMVNWMGHTFPNYPLSPEDMPWCGEAQLKDFMIHLPYPVRAILLPGWNKQYQRYKLMVRSVAGDQDLLEIFDAQQQVCACVIA